MLSVVKPNKFQHSTDEGLYEAELTITTVHFLHQNRTNLRNSLRQSFICVSEGGFIACPFKTMFLREPMIYFFLTWLHSGPIIKKAIGVHLILRHYCLPVTEK